MKKLAVLGPKGTYSDLAAKKLNQLNTIEYYPNIVELIQQVNQKRNALIPFENTLGGFVIESLDGIIQNNLSILQQVKLDVAFTLVSHENTIEDIKEVFVQFKAYSQCQAFILEHHLKPIITQSNIESLTLIQKTHKKGISAIVPNHVPTKEFSLVIPQIMDKVHDETRFVLVADQQPSIPDVPFLSCSLTITPKEDKPGVLYTILKSFNDEGINLKAILSRPRKDTIGKYIFYMELELKKECIFSLKKIQKELEEQENCIFHIVGFYNSL